MENKLPLVSVCIPMYNAAHYVRETLEKLQEQTYPNIEIIIVDDHSTDHSVSIVESLLNEQISLYSNPKKGGNSARNYAFEKSTGDYIKFMDADDYCSDRLIEKQMDRMLADGSPKTLVFSPLKMLESDGRLVVPERRIDQDYNPAIDLLVDIWNFGGFNCPLSHLMPRELVVEAGSWDESILKNQDGEYFARIAKHADKSLSVSEEYVVWRQTGGGVSSKLSEEAIQSVIHTYDIIVKILLDYQASTQMKLICSRYIGRFVYANYAYYKGIYSSISPVLEKYDLDFILPRRKVLLLLRFLFGWRRALLFIHKFKL